MLIGSEQVLLLGLHHSAKGKHASVESFVLWKVSFLAYLGEEPSTLIYKVFTVGARTIGVVTWGSVGFLL